MPRALRVMADWTVLLAAWLCSWFLPFDIDSLQAIRAEIDRPLHSAAYRAYLRLLWGLIALTQLALIILLVAIVVAVVYQTWRCVS